MIITLVFVDITHKAAGQYTGGMQNFYTTNIRNNFHHIYVTAGIKILVDIQAGFLQKDVYWSVCHI